MPSILGTSEPGSVPSVEDLLQAANGPTATHSSGGGFRRVLGGVLGGAANVFLPGIGGVVSGLIGGSAGSTSSLGAGAMSPMQLIQIQQQMAQEQEAFTLASTVLKDRHDAAMEAIRNSKSN